ncbi:MAG: HNH endonuclease signature motif containing protein [Acidimicrobiales bacterium]
MSGAVRREIYSGERKLTSAVLERFEAKIDRRGDCHEWKAAKQRYGMFNAGGVMVRAHRLAYVLEYGGIPEGAHVLHHCDNPGCVNPEHLFLGSHRDNMKDKERKGRARYREIGRKLTAKDVLSIRQRHKDGESVGSIARTYPQLHNSTIHAVVRRKTWKHI